MKIKVALVGENGKMSGALSELMIADPKRWMQVTGFEDADVVIDFSSPSGLRETLKALEKNPRPLVSGTTGLGAAEDRLLKKYSAKAPTLWSANTSLGVSVLRRALRQMAILDGFDFQIEEIHHTQKKDSPSGTAKVLQSELAKVIKVAPPAPVAIRAGGVAGVHKVWAFGSDEWLCFEHVSQNRKVFAVGALKISRWIVDQKPGLYSMDDFLDKSIKAAK